MLGGTNEGAKLWDAGTGKLLRTFPGYGVGAVAFSPDGNRALASQGATLKLWDTATGALLPAFEVHTSSVLSVTFSPNGSGVLSGSDDAIARLWDATTGALLQTFEGPNGKVRSVASHPMALSCCRAAPTKRSYSRMRPRTPSYACSRATLVPCGRSPSPPMGSGWCQAAMTTPSSCGTQPPGRWCARLWVMRGRCIRLEFLPTGSGCCQAAMIKR